MLLAQALGLDTIAWAQGIGPLERDWTRWLTRKALAQCVGVTVRDRASAALAMSWKIEAWYAPDPVWALDSVPVPGLSDFPAPRVAVALRSHPTLTADRLIQIAEALTNFQIATRTSLLLVPFQASKDLAIAEKIQPYLKGPSQILRLTDPRQLKGAFRGAEMAIAMRLHALIMAAAEGCQCFALSYDPKVAYVAEDLDIPGWEMADNEGDRDGMLSLAPWPKTTAVMTQQWLNHFANGAPPSPDQIQSRVDRALIHRELLKRFLSE
jgi:polysaccharide pyruvyl transferase CsaB